MSRERSSDEREQKLDGLAKRILNFAPKNGLEKHSKNTYRNRAPGFLKSVFISKGRHIDYDTEECSPSRRIGSNEKVTTSDDRLGRWSRDLPRGFRSVADSIGTGI